MGLHDVPAQERVKRFLRLLTIQQRMPHALLFSGLPGVGKKAMAFEFAKLMNCLELPAATEGVSPESLDCCDRCSSCRKITAGTHPDLVHIAKSGAYIKLAQIQELRSRLRYRPFEGKWRVVVIEDARDLKEEAGNALLKLLEEPPQRNLFVLLVPELQMLLQTIVSRCCHLRFQPLPEDLISRRLMQDHDLDGAAATNIARLCGGSLSHARHWAEGDRMARYLEVLQRVADLKGQSMMDFFALAEKWAKEGADLEQDLECIKFWLRELLHSRIRKSSNVEWAGPQALSDLGSRLSADAIFQLYEDFDRASLNLRHFANKQLIIEGALLSIKDVFDGKSGWDPV